MPANRSQASEQFVKAVKEFEDKHGKKISELYAIDERLLANEVIATEFFTNPVIHNYLGRKADTIRFLNNKPCDSCLTPTELEIYQLRPDLFPFRINAGTSKFYLDGTGFDTHFFKPLQMRFNNTHLNITSPMDLWEIRAYLNKHAYTNERSDTNKNESFSKVKFILTPNWKDTHATTLVNIIDPETGQVLTSIFINSWDNKDYRVAFSYRFNLKDNYEITSYSEETGFQRFPAKHITERDIPFIDASHKLQVSEGDKNCTLYGAQFLEAIATMLSDPFMAERVFRLAKLTDQKNPEALLALQEIFQIGIKDYLPCYYENKKTKSFSDIKKFHLAKRWDLSSDILSVVYPFKPDLIEPVAEPKRLKTFEPSFNKEGKSSGLQYSGENQVIHYIFIHVIAILHDEKTKLLQKLTPKVNLNAVIARAEEPMREQVNSLDALLDQIYQELSSFEVDPQPNHIALKRNIESLLTSQLTSGVLDKCQGWGDNLLASLFKNAALPRPFFANEVSKKSFSNGSETHLPAP